jgi:hypothetical protein
MANKQTIRLAKQELSTKVIKGANGTGEGGAEKNGALIFVSRPKYKGRPCPTSFHEDPDVRKARGSRRKSARGARTVQRG